VSNYRRQQIIKKPPDSGGFYVLLLQFLFGNAVKGYFHRFNKALFIKLHFVNTGYAVVAIGFA
jgi:hypothetical protein